MIQPQTSTRVANATRDLDRRHVSVSNECNTNDVAREQERQSDGRSRGGEGRVSAVSDNNDQLTERDVTASKHVVTQLMPHLS